MSEGSRGQGLALWAGVIALTLAAILAAPYLPWLARWPEPLVLPVPQWLNAGMAWLVAVAGDAFLLVSWLLDWPIRGVRWLLHALPWSVTTFLVCLLAWAASGWRLALFALASCLYMVVIGYWHESMNTLALVALSVPMAIATGFAIGVLGFRSERAERVIMPTLDVLQTVPVFAYLLPILMLFGFGSVVGLIASVLYSFPPMVRNTIVGLRRVPAEVIESGLMAGATPRQLFWQVRVPTARRQLMLGVNQATMASLSMVIIASIIGGTEDIGWEVLTTLKKARFGESLLAGLVIALMAMVIDRISAGFAARDSEYTPEERSWAARHRLWLVALGGGLALWLTSLAVPLLERWPETLVIYPAQAMNDALTWLVANYRGEIETLKKLAFFFVMLPVKIGLSQAVSPFTWGFAMTPWHTAAYAVLVLVAAGFTAWRGRLGLAVAVVILGIVLHIGVTRLPWPAALAITGAAAWRLGGPKLALGTLAGLLFLLLTGSWPQAMLSVYLCAIAAAISFALGTALGTWAAHSETVSAILRPINDTLQTMPLFVILIPFVMIFKIGDFTALLAIIAYAIVPAIRYAEHGLRNVPEGVIEAARMMGASRWQMLWEVKVPLALPVMMLGLNQTIMYAIAMLVIAALVGTTGLEQTVYIGLGDGDFGVGFTAGIGMAVIAIIADRMTQAWSRKRQQELGLRPA